MTKANIFYGIWIPGQGWLKVDGTAIAFESRLIAQDTAKRVGNRARVEYIDKSLEALEQSLLDVEKNKDSFWKRLSKRFKG